MFITIVLHQSGLFLRQILNKYKKESYIFLILKENDYFQNLHEQNWHDGILYNSFFEIKSKTYGRKGLKLLRFSPNLINKK